MDNAIATAIPLMFITHPCIFRRQLFSRNVQHENSHFRPRVFADVLLEIDAFHRERRIPVRRGRNRREVKQVYIRFCFPDAAIADAFRNRFGGECFTHAATCTGRETDRAQSAKSDASNLSSVKTAS
jgi:hypothetical protein